MRGLLTSVLVASSLASPAVAQHVVHNLDWLRRPTQADLIAVYPREAYQKGQGGTATLNCVVTVQGALRDCAVTAETPAGAGFGGRRGPDAAIPLQAHHGRRPAAGSRDQYSGQIRPWQSRRSQDTADPNGLATAHEAEHRGEHHPGLVVGGAQLRRSGGRLSGQGARGPHGRIGDLELRLQGGWAIDRLPGGPGIAHGLRRPERRSHRP